jgi:hypothetical protein
LSTNNRQARRTVVIRSEESRNIIWQSQTAYTPQNITHKTQRTRAPCELCDNHLIHFASSTISIHPAHAVDTRCATQRLLATCDYTVAFLSILLITLMCTCDVSDNAKTTSLYPSANAHFDMHEAEDLRFMSNLCTLFRLALIARLACHILAMSELASSSVLSTRSSLPSFDCSTVGANAKAYGQRFMARGPTLTY